MEKTLSATDGSYAAVFNAFPEAVSVHRVADGRCLATNERFTAFIGYTAAENVAAGQAGAWIDPEDWQRLSAEVQSDGQANRLAMPVHTKAGAVRPAEVTARRVGFDGAPSLLVIVGDIPERKPVEAAARKPGLRQRAEAKFRASETHPQTRLSPEEYQPALHELRVHQIELEMQNEELRQTQGDLEMSQARYFNLYNLAPVGYVTLDRSGLILEANLTATSMLGVARSAVAKQPLAHFIVPEDQDSFYLCRKELLRTGAPQAFELRLSRLKGTPFWARLEMTAAQEVDGTTVCRVVISDLSAQKPVEPHTP